MTLDFATLDALRTHHPAWRLLRSDHAPLVASFLQRVFVAPNVRVKAAADLAETGHITGNPGRGIFGITDNNFAEAVIKEIDQKEFEKKEVF